MNNRNLLIGAGVLVVGYLLYKKSQKDELNKRLVDMPNKPKSPSDYLEKDSLGMPKLNIYSLESILKTQDFKNPFGATTPKIILGATNNVLNPNNTQGVTRIINDIAIDKLPNIVNQEDIQLFFFNNPNISAIQENTIRDAKGYPIYTRLRKSYIQKDALGTIISGEANEGHFYKENGKFYIRIPQNYGYEICEISESDWIEFFINIKDGSYKKIISPSIKKNNCKSSFSGGSWR
jgi:hypothetical protein